MIFALISREYNSAYNVNTMIKQAMVTYLIRRYSQYWENRTVFTCKIKRYFEYRHIAVRDYIIDLDDDNKEIMTQLNSAMSHVLTQDEWSKTIDFVKHRNILKPFNGTRYVRGSKGILNCLAYAIFTLCAKMTSKEIHSALNPKNIHKSTLGLVLDVFFEYKFKRVKEDRLILKIMDHFCNGESDLYAYYNSVNSKLKEKQDIWQFIKYISLIELVNDIIIDHGEQFDRNTIVRLQNTITLGKLHRASLDYHIVKELLADKFLYSIYKNNYEDEETGEKKSCILVNFVCQNTVVNKTRIKHITRTTKDEYPGLKVHESHTWIPKR